MSAAQLEIQLVAVVVAVACALPGVFLVLRRMAMMSDAISHAILVGIVVAFFIVKDLGHPLLVIGAALTGVLTVTLVELLNKTKLVNEDAAMGLVFPLLFSIGVILIAQHASDVHLDTDAVLMGELAFAPFDRFYAFGWDLGPRSFWIMGGILLLNLTFILSFYKELKLATFDASLAASLGFAPVILHYALMGIVSITAVGAFDAVGSLLVVALMIAPAAAAYLLTDRVSLMLLIAAGIGVASAIGGYWVAHLLDVSIAGSMASVTGLFFLVTFLGAPERGLVAIARRNSSQKILFAGDALVVHLLNHEGSPEAESENRIDHLGYHMRWQDAFARRVIRSLKRRECIQQEAELLKLTDKGRIVATKVMVV